MLQGHKIGLIKLYKLTKWAPLNFTRYFRRIWVMIASEYIFIEDLLWDALNARLFLLVTKENTSVEWKQAIECWLAQVASKWCYTHSWVWNKDGPKYAARLKFSKTPFSHLWGTLQCASLEFNQNFKMYSWAEKCEINLLLLKTSPFFLNKSG